MFMDQALLRWVEGCESCGWITLRKSCRLRRGSSGAHNEPRIHRIESIQTAFLPNLWTEDPSVPFSLQFGSILTSLCGDKDFFLRPWVTPLGYVHSSSHLWPTYLLTFPAQQQTAERQQALVPIPTSCLPLLCRPPKSTQQSGQVGTWTYVAATQKEERDENEYF